MGENLKGVYLNRVDDLRIISCVRVAAVCEILRRRK
jgi:hypothetical protein